MKLHQFVESVETGWLVVGPSSKFKHLVKLEVGGDGWTIFWTYIPGGGKNKI